MSDQGYLSNRMESKIATLLDSQFDFNEIMGNQKKVLGVFAVGNFLERNDRKVFKFMISILDDKLIGKNPNKEVQVAISTIIDLLEAQNVKGFIDYVADIMADKINTPFEGYDKILFQSILGTFSALIGKALYAIERKISEAELEQ